MLGMFGRKDSEAEHAKADLAKEHAELVKVKQDLEAERQVHLHGDTMGDRIAHPWEGFVVPLLR